MLKPCRMPRLAAASSAACVLLSALHAPLAAQQQAESPSVATAGLDVFVATGADSAIAVWLSGATFDTPATRASLGQGFARMAEQRGPMLGYDVVRVFPIGTHVRRVYAVLHYEEGPGYLNLELYRTAGGWVTQAVEFNADPGEVFPPGLLEP
jgi:hypothetical protein